MTRAFRWLPHAGRRHAIRAELVARDEGDTLCGVPLVVPPAPPHYAQWCWPTCEACDQAWRAHEGIAVFPRQRGASGDRRRKVEDKG